MSNRQRVYRTHAVILRRRDFRDADRILTVFTPNFGKLELIAKGIRKTTSRKAGHLELFSHSTMMVAQGRTWDIVTEVAAIDSFPGIRSDLDKIGQANYVSELIDCFSESGDENQALWDLLLLTLEELDELPPTEEERNAHLSTSRVLQHWFEINLLSLAGFQPQLFQCLSCDEELEPVKNYISLIEGGVFCPECGQARRDLEPIEADLLKVLRFLQTRPWQAVRQVNIRPHILRQLENLLYRYVITVLERQLKSVEFLNRLQYMAQSVHSALPQPDAPSVPIILAVTNTDEVSAAGHQDSPEQAKEPSPYHANP
jgi:DNA repair protein RecO (recombination protein O)